MVVGGAEVSSRELAVFLENGNDAETPFLEKLGAAHAYLTSLGRERRTCPSRLLSFVPLPVTERLCCLVAGLDHIGFSALGNPLLTLVQNGTLDFEVKKLFPSCLDNSRKMIRLASSVGTVEVAIDARNLISPHVAWRLKDRSALLEVGHSLRGSGFRVADELENRIWFNRHEDIMFRYFHGKCAGFPVTLEFCW